jgi:hypothetical protein
MDQSNVISFDTFFCKKRNHCSCFDTSWFWRGLYLDKQQQYDHQIIVALILNRPIIYMLKSIYCPPKLLKATLFF